MYEIPDWPSDEAVWTSETFKLFDESLLESPDVQLEDIIDKSNAFPISFPIDTILCKTIKSKVNRNILERNINSAYPLLHERVLRLCADFIVHKRQYGTEKEKKLYRDINVLNLIQKLLNKRAVVFVGASDSYLLRDGSKGIGNWEIIGTDSENQTLNLAKCLSYDEIKLAAFLSVTSYTHFINDGSRLNFGKIARNRENIEDEGVIIGLIGSRTEKPFVMEYEDIVITKEQNRNERGFGHVTRPSISSLFARFYEKPSYTFDDLKAKGSDGNFAYDSGKYFDNSTYAKRMALSMDTLFIEANARARNAKTFSFIHVVGIGLGVWKIFDHQTDLFLQICAKRIEILGEHLHHVSNVFFDYFPESSTCGKYKHGDIIPIEDHPKTGIKVLIGRRDPHEKLSGEHKGKLLVVSYAWDGNALPGNEFWYGSLHTSSDPAAACSTQIAELHNPHINPKVTAHNLRVATPSGVLTLKEYREKLIKKYNFNV